MWLEYSEARVLFAGDSPILRLLSCVALKTGGFLVDDMVTLFLDGVTKI